MGWSGNQYVGFEKYGQKSSESNPATTKLSIKNEKMHTSLVEVRNDGIKAYLDGRLLITLKKSDCEELNIPSPWKLNNNSVIGLGSYASPTIFHKIELRDVKGKGKPLR